MVDRAYQGCMLLLLLLGWSESVSTCDVSRVTRGVSRAVCAEAERARRARTLDERARCVLTVCTPQCRPAGAFFILSPKNFSAPAPRTAPPARGTRIAGYLADFLAIDQLIYLGRVQKYIYALRYQTTALITCHTFALTARSWHVVLLAMAVARGRGAPRTCPMRSARRAGAVGWRRRRGRHQAPYRWPRRVRRCLHRPWHSPKVRCKGVS